MENEFYIEAIRFAKRIYDTIDLSEHSIINARFTLDKKLIDDVEPYRFLYKGIPEFLMRKHAIRAFRRGVEFKRATILYSNDEYYGLYNKDRMEDQIWQYLNAIDGEYYNGVRIDYGHLVTYSSFEAPYLMYPEASKLQDSYAILIFPESLKAFIDNESDIRPKYRDGELQIKGKSIRFKGIQARLLDKLFSNTNTIIQKEDLYKARYAKNDDYDSEVKYTGMTKIHDRVEDSVKKIKSKIEADDVLRNIFYIVVNNGYGLFIDERALKRWNSKH